MCTRPKNTTIGSFSHIMPELKIPPSLLPHTPLIVSLKFPDLVQPPQIICLPDLHQCKCQGTNNY